MVAVITESGEFVFGVAPFFDETGSIVFTKYRATSLTEGAKLVFGLRAEETGAEEIRRKRRGTSSPPWFRAGGRGYFTLIASPRVQVVLHAPPPIRRRRRRVAPLPRGRARRAGTLTRAPAAKAPLSLFRKLRSPRRRLPKSRLWRDTGVPATAPPTVSVAPQERTIRMRRRLQSLPRGRARRFGRTPRIGVTTRPAPLGRVRTRRRATPLPRGRPRTVGKLAPPVPARPAPLSALRRRRRELEPLPRGRARPLAKPQRIGATTRPGALGRVASRKRGVAAPARKVKTKVQRFQPAQPPPFKTAVESETLTAETVDKQKVKSGEGQS